MNWLQKLSQKPMALPYPRPRGDRPESGYFRIDRRMTEPVAQEEAERYPGIDYFDAGSMGLVNQIAPGILMKYTDDANEAQVAGEAFQNKYIFMRPILEMPREIPGENKLWAIVMSEIDLLSQDQQWVTGFLDPTNPENTGLTGGFPTIERTLDVFSDPSVYYHVDANEIIRVYNAYKQFIKDMTQTGYSLREAFGKNLGWHEGRIVLADLGGAKN